MTMRKLISGVLESISSGFAGPVNFLISYTSGKFHASTSQGASYSEINPLVFGSSNINDVEYNVDLSTGITTSNYGIGTTWTPQTTPGGNFYSAAYGNGLWVIVGPNGVTTSTNRVSWSAMNSTNTFLFVSYGNGLWVAGTYSSSLPQANQQRRIQYSTDAVTWVTSNAFFGVTDINDAAYGNSLWVAVGLSGQIRYSTNAISWATSTFGTTRHLRSVAYGNGLWAAVGDYGIIGRSTDAINWVSQVSNYGINRVNAVAYGNGVWIVTGYTAPSSTRVSTDIVTWVTTNPLSVASFFTAGFHSTQFLIAGAATTFGDGSGVRGNGRMSTDGITWTTNQDLSFFNNNSTRVNKVVSDGAGRLLAVGYDAAVPNGKATTADGSIVSSVTVYPNNIFLAAGNSGTLAKSTNGLSWVTLTSNLSTDISSLAYGGVNTTHYSAINWTTQSSNFGGSTATNIVYGNSLWVAVGYGGQIRSSTNAITWVTQNSNFGVTIIRALNYGNGLWVAAGYGGTLFTSTNTVTWVSRNSTFGNTRISTVAYGNGLWLAAGQIAMRASTDAITWVTRTSNFSGAQQIFFVNYANSLWIAVGDGVRTSTDTITWVTRDASLGASNLWSVAFANNLWVASGFRVLRSSTNAISWSVLTAPYTNNARSIGYSNGVWVIGAGSGQVFTSTDTVTWVSRVSNFGNIQIWSVAPGNVWAITGQNGEMRTSVVSNSEARSYFIGGI